MRQYPLDRRHRAAVVATLTQLAGQPVRVVREEGLGHDWAPTTRLHLAAPLPDLGDTVIVKTRRTDGDGHGGPPYVRREAAGLRTAVGSGVTARLVAADAAEGWLVQSDVGPGPTLQMLLLGDDAAAARAGMVAMGTAVGRLHAHTHSRIADHRRHLAESRGDVRNGVVYDAVLDHWREVESACEALGLPPARPVRSAVRALAARTGADAGSTVLVHRDLNPGNVVLADDGAHLIDFEGCHPGPPGIDSAFLCYPFPHHSSPWGTVPPEVSAAALDAYCAALTAGGAAELAGAHSELLADGAAITLIARLSRLQRIDSADDQSPEERWRRRGQVLDQSTTYLGLAANLDDLAPFVAWLAAFLRAAELRWPEEAGRAVPMFPAFLH